MGSLKRIIGKVFLEYENRIIGRKKGKPSYQWWLLSTNLKILTGVTLLNNIVYLAINIVSWSFVSIIKGKTFGCISGISDNN